MASKVIKKTIEEAKGVQNAEIDFSDKGILALEPDMTKMWGMKNITRLTLSHNKITELPPAVAMMENLEILNLPELTLLLALTKAPAELKELKLTEVVAGPGLE